MSSPTTGRPALSSSNCADLLIPSSEYIVRPMIIGLASPRVATSLEDGLERIERLVADAASRGAEIVCFPEAYLPGLRGQDFDVPPFDQAAHDRLVRAVAGWARTYSVA